MINENLNPGEDVKPSKHPRKFHHLKTQKKQKPRVRSQKVDRPGKRFQTIPKSLPSSSEWLKREKGEGLQIR